MVGGTYPLVFMTTSTRRGYEPHKTHGFAKIIQREHDTISYYYSNRLDLHHATQCQAQTGLESCVRLSYIPQLGVITHCVAVLSAEGEEPAT